MTSLLLCVLLACTLVSTLEYSNVSNEYIVMFNSYMAHEDHQHVLRGALVGMDNQWHIIKRNNAASKFPSDFALISVLGETVVGLLKHQTFVKHVFPQRRIVNPLQGYQDDAEEVEEEEDIIATNSTIWGRYHRGFPSFNVDGLVHLPGTRKLHSSVFQVTDLFNAQELWKKYSGTNVNVAIFDTGLRRGHSHFKNVIDITNWTDEDSTEDGLGHGTFVAGMRTQTLTTPLQSYIHHTHRSPLTTPTDSHIGVVASSSECLGFAPDANLHIYRVFTINRGTSFKYTISCLSTSCSYLIQCHIHHGSWTHSTTRSGQGLTCST